MDVTIAEKRNYYVGETNNQLREGYGVYCYANKFFRYEGEWLKGKKHGHGKLLMGDGSYYEGEFKDGEIDGHGYRKWERTGDDYSGEFLKGELHGHGVMNYNDGSQYRGEFCNNQRHGTGVLTDRDGNEYEGAWYKNKKHGQGVQTYFNGDEYEGEWVEGARHGHGELNCVDGSIYEGQWRANMFNGEGSMVHASGVTYEGLWINGKPAAEGKEIVVRLPTNQTHIEVPQGKKFSLQFEIVDVNKEPVVGVHGREFRITAGYRYLPPSKQGNQSILELIEDMEEKPITTPFGYDVLPYPLLENVGVSEETDEIIKNKHRMSPVNARIFGEETIHETHSTEPHKNEDEVEPDDGSIISDNRHIQSEVMLSVEVDDVDVTFSINPPPAPQRSAPDGSVEFKDLYLPSAPPTYRPLLLDEVTPASSVASSRRSVGQSSTSSVRSEKGKRSKGSRNTSAASTSSTSVNESKPGKAGKAKNEEERGAKPGEYLMIVTEVTNPPFLGDNLPPAFVVVKVTTPKKAVKKPTGKRPSLN
uniref:MORN repeat-containing protein 1-like isoform X1 n=1 Tax=Ciona intestinalis TaxID=7719 RepID=UPI00089DC9B3|nr:MORN repeat-containing protein 1-like isoform X1 [Ciona intestinalis]|eukprot:XP_018670628.1 MORN repeat-containing protein 1-like isoform X1 [Ciona intestinalis]